MVAVGSDSRSTDWKRLDWSLSRRVNHTPTPAALPGHTVWFAPLPRRCAVDDQRPIPGISGRICRRAIDCTGKVSHSGAGHLPNARHGDTAHCPERGYRSISSPHGVGALATGYWSQRKCCALFRRSHRVAHHHGVRGVQLAGWRGRHVVHL